MSQSRALGYGLISLGAVLGGVLLLWLATMLVGGELSPGGAILGLLLVAGLGLPLVFGGLYVLSRGTVEEAAEREFRTQRRTFDQDRLFRADQARELEQLARRLDARREPQAEGIAARLRELVHDLERPAYDQAAWYDAVELGRADLNALQRYDDLLTDGARALGSLVTRYERGDPVLPELGRAVQEWERDLARRSDLLRGRRQPTVAPGDLLRAERTPSTNASVAALAVGDAITRDGTDFLVETSISYFGDGRTWWLHRLEAEQEQAWLYVGPGGLELAWLSPTEITLEPGASEGAHGGAMCRLRASSRADAVIRTRGGGESRATVSTWLYSCDDGRWLWLESWPDSTRAYSGGPIKPAALEIWPAQVEGQQLSPDA